MNHGFSRKQVELSYFIKLHLDIWIYMYIKYTFVWYVICLEVWYKEEFNHQADRQIVQLIVACNLVCRWICAKPRCSCCWSHHPILQIISITQINTSTRPGPSHGLMHGLGDNTAKLAICQALIRQYISCFNCKLLVTVTPGIWLNGNKVNDNYCINPKQSRIIIKCLWQ